MSSIGKKLRVLALALLMVSGASVFVCAQGQAPAPNEDQGNGDVQRSGPDRHLAHESREAAGEEKDEMEQFKHSAPVQAIHRITGLSVQQSYWLCMGLNFVVIAGVIVWAGKKFLPGIFRDRTAAIQKAMQEAQKASAEARQKLAEIETRLQKLDVEIGMMRDAAEKVVRLASQGVAA